MLTWKHSKTPAPNLSSVYRGLLIHLIWIQPSFPPRIVLLLQKEVHSVASWSFPMISGIRHSTKYLYQIHGWIINTKQFDLCASPSEWTSVPVQTICWSCSWLCCLYAGTKRFCWLGWVHFPGCIFLICNTIYLNEVQNRAPAEFTESCSPLLVIIRDYAVECASLAAQVCYGGIVNVELFLIMGWKDTACYFYLYKPICTSSAHQISFLIHAARF